MTELLKIAERIEKEVSAPMGDGGIQLSTLEGLRDAIRAEKEKKDATKALAVKRSLAILRDAIQVDAHVREGEYLAALGAAVPIERALTELIGLLTVVRDIAMEKEPDCPYCRNSRVDPENMGPCPECRPQQKESPND